METISSARIGGTRDLAGVVGSRLDIYLVGLVRLLSQVLAVVFGLRFLSEAESEFQQYISPSFLTLPLYGGLREGYRDGRAPIRNVHG